MSGKGYLNFFAYNKNKELTLKRKKYLKIVKTILNFLTLSANY